MPRLYCVLSCVLCLLARPASPKSQDPIASALCRTECISTFLDSEPKDDKECAIVPDCFLCWEHCGLLSRSNQSKDSLCEHEFCTKGCEIACGWFRQKRQLPKDRLVFQGQPSVSGENLSWEPVSGAGLYSVRLVFANRTVADYAQTVACKLKIPKKDLVKVVRIVVIAVNKTGALGLTNYYLGRRLVKKNASLATSILKEIVGIDVNAKTSPSPASLNPALWLSEGRAVREEGAIGRTNISWEPVGATKDEPRTYLVKWWTPDLNMEGRLVVNGSRSVQLTYLSDHFTFVKVKVLGSDEESQILILKKDTEEPVRERVSLTKYWQFLLFLNLCLMGVLVLVRLLWKCKVSKTLLEKPQQCYNVYI